VPSTMDLLVVGINHTTAPVSLREKIAFTPDQISTALKSLSSEAMLKELAILSTCNRTEVYAIHGHNDPDLIINWLANQHNVSSTLIKDSTYTYWGHSSIKHIMRVATGLDSMVLGEPQILGQLKDCFNYADESNTLGASLKRLSQNTYRIAKKVRTSTAIGQNSVSIASTAVDLAGQLFERVSDCNALLIGAGDTTELVARHLRNAGIAKMVIANRTLANAETLAQELGAIATDLTDLPDRLFDADIVISATSSQLPILGKGAVERALKARKHRPIFMVDLAVPRDIEPEVGTMADVYLYSVDDLQEIISENMENRQEAALEAEAIIEIAVKEFQQSNKSLDAVDLLVKFRKLHDAIKKEELNIALQRLSKGEDPKNVLTQFANKLTNKIVHTPSVQLKQASIEGREDIFGALEDLFQLGNDDPDDKG
jgi:glutamyl-tRNA reductase